MKKDQLTEGVKALSVVSGWPVGLSPSEIADPRIVVEAPKGVVVDSNDDNAFNGQDPQPPYGVVGVATIGSGRVVRARRRRDSRQHRDWHQRQREVPRQPARAHLGAKTHLTRFPAGYDAGTNNSEKEGGNNDHS